MTDLTKIHPEVLEAATFAASICHAVNKAICQAFGDDSQVGFDDAPAWQRESAVKGVVFAPGEPGRASLRAAHGLVQRRVRRRLGLRRA